MPRILQNRKLALILLVAALILAAVSGFVPGIRFGEQYVGSSLIRFSYTGNLDLGAFQSAAKAALPELTSVQRMESTTGELYLVATTLGHPTNLTDVADALSQKFSANELTMTQTGVSAGDVPFLFLARVAIVLGVALLLTLLYFMIRYPRLGGFSVWVCSACGMVFGLSFLFMGHTLTGYLFSDATLVSIFLVMMAVFVSSVMVFGEITKQLGKAGRKPQKADIVSTALDSGWASAKWMIVIVGGILLVMTVLSWAMGAAGMAGMFLPLMLGMVAAMASVFLYAVPFWQRWDEKRLARKEAAAQRKKSAPKPQKKPLKRTAPKNKDGKGKKK